MPNRLQLKLRILSNDEIAIGPGKVELLDAICEHGSISAAAKALGMSYRRAWILVDTMNRCFREPLVLTITGGNQGGGTTVTKTGKAVIAIYLSMQRKSETATRGEFNKLLKMLTPT